MDPQEFIDQDDIEFSKIETASSLKTNMLMFARNWSNLEKYLSNLKAYLRYINGILDIDEFLSRILESFQDSKTEILIDRTYAIGSKTIQKFGNVSYTVERVSDKLIEIVNSSTPGWNVNRLIVDVKSNQGVQVYPVITTLNSKISIYFNDGIVSNYIVLFI